jgi:OFA family oxalate/formate antiporter-like MFS transporter
LTIAFLTTPDGGRVKKWCVVAAVVAIQICLGGVYAWSVFASGLSADYGLSHLQTQAIFGFTIATFTLSMVAAGRIEVRTGPRAVALAGGILLATGYLIGGASGGSFALLWAGLGVVCGIGTGFGYVACLTACVGWFPRHKGLITGVSVAGFGGGAVVLTLIAEAALESGINTLEVFHRVGLAYGAVVIGASLLLFRPLPHAASPGLPPLQRLPMDRQFFALVLGMFCGTFSGLMLVGNLKPLTLAFGLEAQAASAAILAFSAGNAAGRVSWGYISDRVGRYAIPGSLLFMALTLVPFLLPPTPSVFVAACASAGFGYGGCFVVYAARVAEVYGSDRVGTVYPWIFLAYGASALAGPPLGGLILDLANGPHWAVVLASLGTLGGAFAYTALNKGSEPSEPGERKLDRITG